MNHVTIRRVRITESILLPGLRDRQWLADDRQGTSWGSSDPPAAAPGTPLVTAAFVALAPFHVMGNL